MRPIRTGPILAMALAAQCVLSAGAWAQSDAVQALPTGPGSETVQPPLPERQRPLPPQDAEQPPLTLEVEKPLPPTVLPQSIPPATPPPVPSPVEVEAAIDLNLRCQGLMSTLASVAEARKVVTTVANPEFALGLLQSALVKTVEIAATRDGLSPAAVMQRGKDAAKKAIPKLRAQIGTFVRMVRGQREQDIEALKLQETLCNLLLLDLKRGEQ